MEFLDPKIDAYTEEYSQPESEVLKALNRETWAKVLMPRMLSGHLQGRVLSILSKIKAPKRILEVGTYTGYSALCLAEGLTADGVLHTIDINEELTDMVKRYIQMAGMENKIIPHVGNAMEIIPQLKEDWDLVFIDADKENYYNYYNLVIDQLKPGALVIADNVLWSGKVTDHYQDLDEETRALVDYSRKIHEDPRVENVLFPIRDGLMVCRKV